VRRGSLFVCVYVCMCVMGRALLVCVYVCVCVLGRGVCLCVYVCVGQRGVVQETGLVCCSLELPVLQRDAVCNRRVQPVDSTRLTIYTPHTSRRLTHLQPVALDRHAAALSNTP